MSTPEIERFSKDVAGNESLRGELKAIGTDKGAIVAFANSKGYKFSLQEMDALAQSYELSDQDLQNVAGGIFAVGSGNRYLFKGGANVILNW
jgi:predicted ribosomally synthesized peptide with nif11-like leader